MQPTASQRCFHPRDALLIALSARRLMAGVMRLSLLIINVRGARMSKGRLKLTTPLMILALTAFYIEAKPQESAFDGLEKYLNQRMAGPEAVKVIKQHLIRSGTSNLLDELVAWAKAGFADLQDEQGYWKTEGLSLKLGVVNSIHYNFST